jgi:site-specific recombinase XerD
MSNKKLSELFKEFIVDCEIIEGLREETIRGYKQSFILFNKYFPDLTTEQLSSKILRQFFITIKTRERIVGKNNKKIGVKSTTIATYRSKLNRFFKWLKNQKYMDSNPMEDVSYPKVEYKDRKYLKKEQIEKILISVGELSDWRSTLIGKRNKLIIYLGMYCGLRRGEFMNIKLDDINLDRKLLTVNGDTSKSKITRVIPMNGRVVSLLKDYLIDRKRKGYKTSYLLVSRNRDNKFTYHGLKHLVEKIKKTSGIPFHVHSLRHTYAVNSLYQGTDIAKLKQLMGHSDIRMTALYLRCMPTKAMRSDVELLNIESFL